MWLCLPIQLLQFYLLFVVPSMCHVCAQISPDCSVSCARTRACHQRIASGDSFLYVEHVLDRRAGAWLLRLIESWFSCVCAERLHGGQGHVPGHSEDCNSGELAILLPCSRHPHAHCTASQRGATLLQVLHITSIWSFLAAESCVHASMRACIDQFHSSSLISAIWLLSCKLQRLFFLRPLHQVIENGEMFSQLFQIVSLAFNQSDLGLFKISLETLETANSKYRFYSKVLCASACLPATII